LFLIPSCHTPARFAPVNLAEAGWLVQHGQGLWKANKHAPELAGDLLVARHVDGRALVQFSKIPFPSVAVQTQDKNWQVEYQPQDLQFSGHGTPPWPLNWRSCG